MLQGVACSRRELPKCGRHANQTASGTSTYRNGIYAGRSINIRELAVSCQTNGQASSPLSIRLDHSNALPDSHYAESVSNGPRVGGLGENDSSDEHGVVYLT